MDLFEMIDVMRLTYEIEVTQEDGDFVATFRDVRVIAESAESAVAGALETLANRIRGGK